MSVLRTSCYDNEMKPIKFFIYIGYTYEGTDEFWYYC